MFFPLALLPSPAYTRFRELTSFGGEHDSTGLRAKHKLNTPLLRCGSPRNTLRFAALPRRHSKIETGSRQAPRFRFLILIDDATSDSSRSPTQTAVILSAAEESKRQPFRVRPAKTKPINSDSDASLPCAHADASHDDAPDAPSDDDAAPPRSPNRQSTTPEQLQTTPTSGCISR